MTTMPSDMPAESVEVTSSYINNEYESKTFLILMTPFALGETYESPEILLQFLNNFIKTQDAGGQKGGQGNNGAKKARKYKTY